jgi:hypothetical protein
MEKAQMSWANHAYAAIRKIVLLRDRMIRVEAKFELIEKLGSAKRRRLPNQTGK